MGIVITQEEGCWIRYQLDLNGVTQTQVADTAFCTSTMITEFLKGRKGSERVKTALVEILGYKDFEALLEAARQGAA